MKDNTPQEKLEIALKDYIETHLFADGASDKQIDELESKDVYSLHSIVGHILAQEAMKPIEINLEEDE